LGNEFKWKFKYSQIMRTPTEWQPCLKERDGVVDDTLYWRRLSTRQQHGGMDLAGDERKILGRCRSGRSRLQCWI